MVPAVITLAFDPLVYFGDVTVRAATILLAAILLGALLVLTRIGLITPTEGPYVPAPTLNPWDLPFLVLGIVPGAVLGGRLDYVLVHLDYYVAHPDSAIDPTQGALGLGLAVPGAIIGGALIARLIDAPLDRWMHAAVLPTLFALAAGKFSGVLSADGQGQSAGVAWATAYVGDGPWNSLAASIPSHPSQVYEAIAVTVILLVLGLALRAGAFARRDGSALGVAIVLWALARMAVATTWRDMAIAGPLRAEQLILIAVVAGSVVGIVRIRRQAESASHSRFPGRTSGGG
jgi:phosphatidylglycerol:prolipoprotein diacylglycerol transferase